MAQELKSLWNRYVDDSSLKIVKKNWDKPLSIFNIIIDDEWTKKLFGPNAFWLIDSSGRSLHFGDIVVLKITDSKRGVPVPVGCDVILDPSCYYHKFARGRTYRHVETCLSLEKFLEEFAEDIKNHV